METTIEERLVKLEAQRFAQGLALKFLIAILASDQSQHAALREKVCGAVDRLYDRHPEIHGASEEGHLVHQMILVEVEALFDLPTPRAE
jgi:uncharacterized coiled-coil protein SlyX